MIVGIEIGGTKLQLAVASAAAPSVLIETLRPCAIDRAKGAEGILAQISAAMADLQTRYAFTKIGVGFGGPVEIRSGRSITSHHVHGWDDFPLADWFRARWPLPVAIDNDCNVAALAEARLGAGQHARRVFYITVGTGVGGGFVVDGRVDGKERPAIAEVGHLRPGLDATSPAQTIESLASGSGIERTAAAALADPAGWGCSAADAAQLWQFLGGEGAPITARQVGAAALAAQPLASKVLEQATRALGWALAQVTTLMAPETIVIGGGVSLLGDPFLAAVRTAWRAYVFPPLADHCTLKPAALGEAVVLHGAILLTLE
jgi:glucokinase